MLFQFLRPQLERERPTITSTARRAGESGRMAIGAHMSVALASDASIRSPAPVVTVKARRSSAP